jgi:type IV fimbrial biogenesis protein FimT
MVALHSVRLRALAEQRPWQVCGGSMVTDCDNVWSAHWQAVAEGQTNALILQPDIPNGWRVYWRGFRQRPFIEWTADGDAADSNGTLTLCAPIAQDAALRQIVISRSGRMRIQVPQKQSASTLMSARAVCGW